MAGISSDTGSDSTWPDEVAVARAPFYGIRTAALLANESRWVHRRVEQLELLDERRVRRQVSVDFTLPALQSAPWDGDTQLWFVPVALLRRGLLTSLDVRDESGRSLPVLTREQNSVIAYKLLAFLAGETLEEVVGVDTELATPLLCELADIAGARRGSHDQATDEQRGNRTKRAIRLFRVAAVKAVHSGQLTRLQAQRQALWRDETMRGFMSILSQRFILLVPVTAVPGTRRIVKLSYEQRVAVPPLLNEDDFTSLRAILRAIGRYYAHRAGSSFGLAPVSFRVSTRAVFGPESFHVEIPAPDELLIDSARLDRMTLAVDLETGRRAREETCVAEDFCTERAHLYESLFTGGEQERATPSSANEETTTASAITVQFFMRPTFLRPPLVIGIATCTVLLTGLLLKWIGVPRVGDVTALIVVLPALFAAYLIPGEHRLVRRMFRGVRFLVLMLSAVSFAAAGTLTLSLASSTHVIIWLLLLAVALGCTGTIAAAVRVSSRKMVRRPMTDVHSVND